jgi:RNA polymerase sigma-70 factor (ECF subfamily)
VLARESPVTPADEQLIAAAHDGDLNAFNQLVERYERLVYAVCYRLLGNAQRAENVTQETFIRAYAALCQFRGGAFRSWLLRIATNQSYDLLRQERRRTSDSLDALPVEVEPRWTTGTPADDPVHFAERSELGRRLENALAELPDDQRLVVILSDIHGYPYGEIAEIIGVPAGTVKSRLSRGRARLRDVLRADDRTRELLDAVIRRDYDEHDG